MANTPYSDVSKKHTPFSGVAKKHTGFNLITDEGGRHTYGHEYGETTRILFGDHVRIGGQQRVTDSAAYSNVTL